MPRWVQRRLGFLILVFLSVLVLNFFLIRLMTGDIADFLAPDPNLFPEIREDILREFGLDKSLGEQFVLYVKNTFTGNLGVSFKYTPRTVLSLILETAPRSVALVIAAQLITVFIGYLLGVFAGWRAGSKTDTAVTGISLTIWAAPMFWVAMIILFVVGFKLGWFPLAGYRTIGIVQPNIFLAIIDRLRYMVMPVFTLVFCRFGAAQLIMRNTITITLKENYITTAEAKGISERRVKHRHAGRNALLPLVTSTTLGIGAALTGSIFIEKIFSYPGMGRLIFDSVLSNDYPLFQGTFLMSSALIITAIFLLDFIYAFLDPRVRYE